LWSPSSRLLCGVSAFWPCLRVAMSSAGDCHLPHLITEDGPGAWSSSATLYRFVWVVKRGCMSQTALHAILGRAALVLWIVGLDLRDFKESGSKVGSPGEEGMLDWIVVSIRRGWTHKEVFTWMSPSFGGFLYDMALDAFSSV
jgi:hypothetical protein